MEWNLLIGAKRHEERIEQRAVLERIHNLFPILRESRHQLVGNMSSGRPQMCALACGLMPPLRLLAVDERS
jgi:branched-chain amino acid transport system ATP-binding protein